MKRNDGFTIIELLTVVVVFGIIAAIGIPTIRSYSRSIDIQAAASQMAADMWYARQRAIATSEPHSVFFATDENQYSIFRDDGNGVSYNAANGAIDVGEEVLATKNLDARLHLSQVNLDPDNAVIFMPRGSLKVGTGGGYVTVSGDNGSRTVLIRASGLCKVE
jgi:type II secretion system protein H